MKINIKNLKGEVFAIQIDASETIGNLKQKLQKEKGLAADSQKIIFKGKTTTNEDQIEKLGLKESDFLVVMTQKPQPKPKVEEKVEVSVPKAEEKKEQKKDNNQPASSNQAQITQLMSMGFPREQCVAALQAAFNNSDRAVEYLLNGIPSTQSQSQVSNPLAALNTLPQFQELRALIQSDPTSLPQVLSQLAQTSPQLYNIIAQHPEQFERLIMEGGDIDEEGQEDLDLGEEGQGEGQEELVVTQQQEAAINRLASLGFSKIEAAQAYIACDKNEQMAANLLFDRLANGDIEQSFPGGLGGHPDQDDDNIFN